MSVAVQADIAPAVPRPGIRQRMRPVLELARPHRSYLRYGVSSGVLQQVLFMAGASIAAYAVGRAVLGATYSGLVFYLLGLVVIVVLQVRTPWLESISCQYIANRVQVTLREQIFGALARLTPGGLSGRRSGELGSAALADVEVIQSFFAKTISTLIVAIIAPVLALAALAVLSWQLSVALLPLLVVAASVPAWLHRRAGRQGADLRAELAGLSADVVDDVQGLREILTFGAEAAVLADLASASTRARRLQAVQARREAAEDLAAELIATAGALIVLGVGAMLVAQQSLPVTFLPPCAILAALAFGPVTRLVDAAKGLGEVVAAGDRIFALVTAPAAVTDGSGPALVEVAGHPGVDFRDVCFRYGPDLPQALTGITFRAEAGETVALVGHSGAGKSTCISLLLRFWDAESGTIRVGGVDVRDLPQGELHSMVGFVSQDVYLFNTSMRENLTLGRPDATDAEIEKAARAAVAWEFIEGLPDGLDTETGERGVQLSGGQRQRVAIARAFLADPPVLVLDEPVSNLDSENERAITDAMARIRAGRTTLIVAHRLSTIRTADRVVVLDHGQVAQIGTHQQLMASGGTYADLVASQLNS